ncbi:MAG: hypothetical protein JKY84_14570 [Emcibacteraceae bacterium]|nr:hypothetical protein [Emcibacteraceae bacterium]
MRSKLLKNLCVLFISYLTLVAPSSAQMSDVPIMSDEKNYTEYWEQYFYLSDGSLVTSQFLVANFPWPVGKKHGIMLGTLVTPDGKLYTIKNGRKLGEWGFSEKSLDMFIHTHTLKRNSDGFNHHLENTMGIVDLSLTSHQAPINHKRYSSEDGYIETSIYAPSMTGFGNWQLGPEAGFDPNGPVHNADNVTGFGVHVTMTDKVDKLITNWTRILGLGNDGPKPFLSAITRPDGKQDIILKLFDGNLEIDSFSDIDIKYQDMTKEKNATYPKSIKISAKGENGTLKGTIKFTKKLAHFNLTEHLNFFERTFAKSSPVVTNFRYVADYDLVYKTSSSEKNLKGKALSEYTDVTPAKRAKAKKRRRNRR